MQPLALRRAASEDARPRYRGEPQLARRLQHDERLAVDHRQIRRLDEDAAPGSAGLIHLRLWRPDQQIAQLVLADDGLTVQILRDDPSCQDTAVQSLQQTGR